MPPPRCPSCGAETVAAARFCANCGGSLATTAVVTEPAGPAEAGPYDPTRGFRLQAEGTRDGRFPVGIVLGERYRILGLLGHGGMGEVYRAHDLKLEQQVALKFLPESAALNPSLLERFRSEVRIARQISHRNVCRVYDLGDINGAAFISMEYVDGEDLASLLRRIGRLPGDKALEFARKLCAGLAAAHEQGVLHRDLKPANIMIDGRGQLLIMDFGLAAVANAVSGHEIRSGTPAYMSPEQKEGREVTVRSDIYALGLVLAEMFSGSRPTADGTLSTTTKDVDPIVEKVIQRCVDPNPAHRFAAVLDVARALPGGDPLAEALAAGETPSPAMVAASEDAGILSVRTTIASMLVIVLGIVSVVYWGSQTHQVNLTPMPYATAVLEQKARELIAGFGYTQTPRDTYRRFEAADDYTTWAMQNLTVAERRRHLDRGEPSELLFRFVQSPQDVLPENPPSFPSETDPVRPPGSVEVLMDPQARLRVLHAVPARTDSGGGVAFDWHRLFAAAGLDASRWTSVTPQQVPPTAFDEQRAWTGSYPAAPQISLRVEAAAWKGRPVFFQILGPWLQNEDAAVASTLSPRAVLIGLILAGVWLVALHNLRSGRGDLGGATRLAVFVLICFLIGIGNVAHHPMRPEQIDGIVGMALLVSAIAWALYMAIEPHIRRHWPQVLIAWSRALAGRFRDPVVCGHILVGMAVGFVVGNLDTAIRWFSGVPYLTNPLSLYASRIGAWATDVSLSPLLALFMFATFVIARLVLRRTWLAAAAVFLFVSGNFLAQALPIGLSAYVVVIIVMRTTIEVGLAARFGLLALAANIAINRAITGLSPFTPDFSAWYAPQGLLHIGFMLGIALWCFRHALGGRTLLRPDLLDG
jgi:hypothetical protein